MKIFLHAKTEIFIFIVLQFLGWGGFFLLRFFGINYLDSYLITTIYFILLIGLFIYLFKDEIKPGIYLPSRVQILLVILLYFFLLLFYSILDNIPKISSILDVNPGLYVLITENVYILTKSLEIFYQQITIAILVFLLNFRLNLTTKKITHIFTTVFVLLHLFNLLYMPLIFAIIFILGSFVAGLVFPKMIIKNRDGFIYTYLLHWLFYVVLDATLVIYYL